MKSNIIRNGSDKMGVKNQYLVPTMFINCFMTKYSFSDLFNQQQHHQQFEPNQQPEQQMSQQQQQQQQTLPPQQQLFSSKEGNPQQITGGGGGFLPPHYQASAPRQIFANGPNGVTAVRGDGLR